ncbi:MAG: ABC transporter permease, partial [Microbacteriaceae bacterium]|nr:ABC transporter permease [Microbacteriaceae bacterium]
MTSVATAPVRPARRPRRRAPVLVAISIVVLAAAAVLALIGGWLAPDATKGDVLAVGLPPGVLDHALGTDIMGRDVLALTIAGAASALAGPVVVALGSMLIGIVLGTLAGYERGWVDLVVGRVTDLLFALPVMLMALVVAGLLGAGYWTTVLLLIVLFSPSDIRIVRAGVLDQTTRPYIEATQMLGLPRGRIMFRHLLPNVVPLIITNTMLNIAFALVSFSGLSFLGVGVPPRAADWGRQLADGRELL